MCKIAHFNMRPYRFPGVQGASGCECDSGFVTAKGSLRKLFLEEQELQEMRS